MDVQYINAAAEQSSSLEQQDSMGDGVFEQESRTTRSIKWKAEPPHFNARNLFFARLTGGSGCHNRNAIASLNEGLCLCPHPNVLRVWIIFKEHGDPCRRRNGRPRAARVTSNHGRGKHRYGSGFAQRE
jgi:hypothetical protein